MFPLPLQVDVVPRHGPEQGDGPLDHQGEDDGIPHAGGCEPVFRRPEIQEGKCRHSRDGEGVVVKRKRTDRHVLDEVGKFCRRDFHAAQVHPVLFRVHRVEPVFLRELPGLRGADEYRFPRNLLR